YIEPARQFPGVQTVRDLAFYDLDAAMIQALENTLSEIKKRGIEPDKRTEDALADLRRGHVL
ncbi:MAG: nicotinate-nucleotide adenylyltransferase, partial [Lentisphaerae bacterium]|nr:nicotinate-nucleotide adenylyltransferase [Lentisphaerota bacterium]